MVALALAAALGAVLHEAVHALQDPEHSADDCVACQAVHGAGLPAAAPAATVPPTTVSLVQLASNAPILPVRFHAGHPRGPPV